MERGLDAILNDDRVSRAMARPHVYRTMLTRSASRVVEVPNETHVHRRVLETTTTSLHLVTAVHATVEAVEMVETLETVEMTFRKRCARQL